MSASLREKFVRVLTLVLLAVIVGGGLMMAAPSYRRSENLKRQDMELQAKIDAKKREIAVLAENQRRFRTDADFVEMIARRDRRVFPGELVFIYDN